MIVKALLWSIKIPYIALYVHCQIIRYASQNNMDTVEFTHNINSVIWI